MHANNERRVTRVSSSLRKIRATLRQSYEFECGLGSATAQLHVAVHRLELDARPARSADMRANVLGIEAAAHGHFKIGIERAIDRFEIDVAAEVAGELHDDVAVDRVETHGAV